jgi:hypothetical protein
LLTQSWLSHVQQLGRVHKMKVLSQSNETASMRFVGDIPGQLTNAMDSEMSTHNATITSTALS